MSRVLLLFSLSWICFGPAWSQDSEFGRSMATRDCGIVATSQVEGSRRLLRVLARSGSALDAAIPANAVLGGAEHVMHGFGGDLFL